MSVRLQHRVMPLVSFYDATAAMWPSEKFEQLRGCAMADIRVCAGGRL